MTSDFEGLLVSIKVVHTNKSHWKVRKKQNDTEIVLPSEKGMCVWNDMSIDRTIISYSMWQRLAWPIEMFVGCS